jgi:hypothetical protein
MTTNATTGRGPAVSRILLTAVILELTLATAVIHLGLGGTLFTLNGLGYAGLAVAYGVAALAPIPAVRRFAWLPGIGLAAYTLATIVAYLVIGPYFTLGWITKGIEAAIVGLVVVDLLDGYGSPGGLLRSAVASVSSLVPGGRARAHG